MDSPGAEAFSELANAVQIAIVLSAQLAQQRQQDAIAAAELQHAIQRAAVALSRLRESSGQTT